LETFDIFQKSRVPVLVAHRDTAEVVFGIRRIDRDHIEILEFCGNYAAFCSRVAIAVVGNFVLFD
jgi:hypothetical protein